MHLNNTHSTGRWRGLAAVTLVEVVLSIAICGISLGAIVFGYIGSAKRAEWSAYSLAANSMAMQRLEQTRAAKFDVMSTPPVDELTAANFPEQIQILDVPINGQNITYATNYTVITSLSTAPPLKMIRVDCVWDFKGVRLFTNTMITYRAADQ